MQANAGPTAQESQHRPTKANTGPRKPTTANAAKQQQGGGGGLETQQVCFLALFLILMTKSTYRWANAGPRRPMTAHETQRSKAAAGGLETRHVSSPGMFFVCFLFYFTPLIFI